MKLWLKRIFTTVIAMFILTGMSSCVQNRTPESVDEQRDLVEDETTSDDKVASDNDEAQNKDKKSESPEDSGKLVPNPTVDVREGMDYLSINVPAKDFELKDLNGNTVKLADYEGQIVFLNFWTTWCPYCIQEMPDLEEIHKQYGDKGVAILTINSTGMELRGGTDSAKAKQQAEKFIKEKGYTFPVLLDSDDEVIIEYSKVFPVISVPTTFMIDKKGQIRYARPGAFISKEQIEAFIALLDD